MQKNKYIISFLLVLTSYCFGYTQDSLKTIDINFNERHKHNFGLNFGTFTGSGLAYKYQPDRCGVQFTATPPLGDEYFTCISLTGLYRILEERTFNVVAFAAAGVGTFVFDMTRVQSPTVPLGFRETEGGLNIGTGFGLERNTERINFIFLLSYGTVDLGYPIISLEFGLFYRFH